MTRSYHEAACKVVREHCRERGIVIKPIPESRNPNEPTPDFEGRIDDKCVVFEVKVIEPTKEDIRNAEKLNAGEIVVGSHTPGDGLVGKLKKANKQLRLSANLGIPGITCVFDYRGLLLYPIDIHAGMFGQEKLLLSVPRDYSQQPRVVGRISGGRESLTKTDNTSTSAVMIFCPTGPDQYDARLFHNHFAKFPLSEKCASRLADEQYRSDNREGPIGDPWIRIV